MWECSGGAPGQESNTSLGTLSQCWDWIGSLFHVAQWGYGQSVTEESDGVLDLVDSCLEVMGDLVVAKQFFCDDAILQLRHQFCGETL